LDRDPRALSPDALAWTADAPCRVLTQHRPFAQLESAVAELGLGKVHGVLADLGVSSPQLDEMARGFSFRGDAPLDMRMDTTSGMTAAELIANTDADALADLIFEWGEERHSRRVARALKEAQPTTTRVAADAIGRVVPRSKDGLHPATRTFQALRMAVNGEMEQLQTLLAAIPGCWRPAAAPCSSAFTAWRTAK
jgi:16S rRNA (cytosine1402-N4)-methyltransferase